MQVAGLPHLHYREFKVIHYATFIDSSWLEALLTYATMLAFYLHLRASTKYTRRPELLTSHPIMQRLLTLKQSVLTLEDLGFAIPDSEPEFDEDDDESLDLTGDEDYMEELRQKLEPGELDDLLQDAQMFVSSAKPKPRSRVVKTQPLVNEPQKKKRRILSEPSKASVPIFDLEEPEFIPSSRTKIRSRSKANTELDDAYGEASHLQVADAADKSARKKSLRFHTSRIESTNARRQGARSQAMGGDDDIPYHERQKEKMSRLLQEAKNQLHKQGGEDLDDSEPPERKPEKRKRDDEDDLDGPDGYYELVKKKTKENKEQKKADYDAVRAAER